MKPKIRKPRGIILPNGAPGLHSNAPIARMACIGARPTVSELVIVGNIRR